jgi:hypothetical protein
MRPTSTAFKNGVRSSHQMASRVRVVAPGQNGVNPTGTVIPITAGSITFDSTAQVQATADITTTQPWAASSSDLLTIYGNEIFVERGLVYGGGSVEWVSLGYYRIDNPHQASAPSGSVELRACPDRMQGLIDARIPSPFTFAAGTTVASIIQTLVLDAYSWATFSIDASLSAATINVAQTTTDDRYGFINTLVTSYGMIWYWDYRGVLVVKTPPALTSTVATIKTGHDGVITTLSRDLQRTGVYSGCFAQGQQATANVPLNALVVNNDPTSPTYWFGPFGKIPLFYTSSFLTSIGQCQSAAKAQLQQNSGVPYEVDFGMVPNPALELWDPIRLEYPGRVENHILKQMVIGLAASDSMTAQTRQLVNGAYVAV